MSVDVLTAEQTRRVHDYYPGLGNRPPAFDLPAKLDAIIAQANTNETDLDIAEAAIDALELTDVANAIADPGDGNAIDVTTSGTVNLTSGGSGETRTLADPSFAGQEIVIGFDVDGGGDVVVTAASAANQAGNNTLTLADAGDILVAKAIDLGGSPVWRIVANDGVGLTTV